MRDINLPTTDHIRIGYCTSSYDENADAEFDLWLATERNRVANLAIAKERQRIITELERAGHYSTHKVLCDCGAPMPEQVDYIIENLIKES